MNTEVIIDYAMPLMNIERMAKDVHNACLAGNLHGALDSAVALAAESKLLINSLKVMIEKEESR
jgi:hypothetical protein